MGAVWARPPVRVRAVAPSRTRRAIVRVDLAAVSGHRLREPGRRFAAGADEFRRMRTGATQAIPATGVVRRPVRDRGAEPRGRAHDAREPRCARSAGRHISWMPYIAGRNPGLSRGFRGGAAGVRPAPSLLQCRGLVPGGGVGLHPPQRLAARVRLLAAELRNQLRPSPESRSSAMKGGHKLTARNGSIRSCRDRPRSAS